MTRTILSTAFRVGRATALALGVAVMLAVVLGLASAALGADGQNFKLGKSNIAQSVTTLVKSGAGPALDLQVGFGPPLAVNSSAKVNNLNADQVDSINFYRYFMDTDQVQDYPFGQAKLQTTGTPGEFKVCENTSATVGQFDFVVYVNGTRTTGSIPLNPGGCSSAFDVGVGGDFQVTIRRAQIFGVHSGDSATNEDYSLYGFSEL